MCLCPLGPQRDSAAPITDYAPRQRQPVGLVPSFFLCTLSSPAATEALDLSSLRVLIQVTAPARHS